MTDEAEDVERPLDCGNCGEALAGKDPRPGWYWDCEVIECVTCHVKNLISCDDERAYVSSWICRHGKRDDEPCGLCEPSF